MPGIPTCRDKFPPGATQSAGGHAPLCGTSEGVSLIGYCLCYRSQWEDVPTAPGRGPAVKKAAFSLLVLLAAVTALHAQFWQKKPPQEWSKSDCQKMLSDSPWTRSRVVSDIMLARTTEPGSVQTPGRDVQPEIRYQVRFLSALPVRQALVRQVQLSPQFQKLSPEERKSAEERQAGFINTVYPDHVVVQVSYSTNVVGYQLELERAMSLPTPSEMRISTFLNTPAGRIELLDVIRPAGGGELHLVFPRNVDGKPVLQPTDKKVSVEFTHPRVGALPSERIFVEFKVKDMLLDGQLVY